MPWAHSCSVSYRAGERKLKLHTGIQVVGWDTCRCRERESESRVWTHLWRTNAGFILEVHLLPPSLLFSLPEGAGRLIPRMMYRIISLGVRLEWHLKKPKTKKMWPCRRGVSGATDDSFLLGSQAAVELQARCDQGEQPHRGKTFRSRSTRKQQINRHQNVFF